MTDKDLEKGNLEEEVKETEIPENSEEQTEAAAEEMTAEDLEAEEGEGKAEKKEKKGFFSKKKDPRDTQIEELTDRLKRSMAEFDNFRKRTEKEKSAMYEIGAKDIIEKLLPVVDNFERGFTTVAEEDKEDAFVTGMEMVYKQLMTMLEGVGVKPIEAVGQEFNPDFHNAVMQVESDEYESGIIAQEFMKGYMYKDTVVRHSMVGVVS